MAAPDGDLLLHFDHSPRAIVAAITNLRRRREEVLASLEGSDKMVIGALLLTGMLVLALDIWLGYQSHLYSFAGAGIIVVGLWTWRRYWRAKKQPSFNRPEFMTAKDVIHALRDDIAPKRNMHGTIDLRGLHDSKKVRKGKDARGRTVSYYRNDWLTVKTKLYDGSMLRFAVVSRVKRRDGFYKRGRASGRRKWKPPKMKSVVQRLDVRVSPNPELYTVSARAAPLPGQKVGHCTISEVSTEGGLVAVRATKSKEPTAQEVLEVLRLTYGMLERKAVA